MASGSVTIASATIASVTSSFVRLRRRGPSSAPESDPAACSRAHSSVGHQPKEYADTIMAARISLGAGIDCGQPRRIAVFVSVCPALSARPSRGEAITSTEVRVPLTAPAAEFQLWPTSVCLRLSTALTKVTATKANAIGRRTIGRYVSRCEGA